MPNYFELNGALDFKYFTSLNIIFFVEKIQVLGSGHPYIPIRDPAGA